MSGKFPPEIADQTARAVAAIKRHAAAGLEAVHLFGSAVDGGLKAYSDMDLFVTVRDALDEAARRGLMLDLLELSAPPGSAGSLRPLEVTVAVRGELVPWRYPPRRELQFGEWLRRDILAGIFEPAVFDPDLAILVMQIRQCSHPLVGRKAEKLFAPVPEADFHRALAHVLEQWNGAADWAGDERNVVLAVARIWYSLAAGGIAPKDAAAAWLLERLPVAHRGVLRTAREAYLGRAADTLAAQGENVAEFIRHAKFCIDALRSTADKA